MGNPHAITYVDNVMNFPLEKVGPKMEVHSLYPKKINSEFVQIIDRNTLKMRVWERGREKLWLAVQELQQCW